MQYAGGFHEQATRAVVRVGKGFAEIQHWGKADIRTFQQLAPGIAGASQEQRLELLAKHRPVLLLPLLLEIRIVDTTQLQQQLIELRFDAANRHEFSVGAGVATIERRAAIEHVALALVVPLPLMAPVVIHAAEQGRAVADGSVHHLPQSGFLCLEQACQNACHQKHRPAPHVAHQMQRRRRWPVSMAHGIEYA
ncbi:hypothetical protein D3C86_1367630 [compost metagenome]